MVERIANKMKNQSAHADACVQPAFTFFEQKFWREIVNSFKAAHLFDPTKVVDLNPDCTT